jgi:hypothetical protein
VAELDVDRYPARNEVFYGLGVWDLGEDGEWGVMVEGHGPRALAALCAHWRDVQGRGWQDDIRSAEPVEKWVVFHEECGCTEAEHAAHVERTPDGLVIAGCDFDCKRVGLPPCQPDRYAWAWDYAEADTPGALPVLEVRW